MTFDLAIRVGTLLDGTPWPGRLEDWTFPSRFRRGAIW